MRPDKSHSKPVKPSKLFNLYEEYPSGRRLSETVDDFLSRLPPSSGKLEDCGPWIFVSNPTYDPHATREDIRGVKEEGNKLLEDFENEQTSIEDKMSEKTKNAIGRKIGPLRTQLASNIYAMGRKKGVTAGKWMLFLPEKDVDRVWRQVVEATIQGDLGHAAKVASNDGSGESRSRLICVYNEDWEDKMSVKKVVGHLHRLGLVNREGMYGREQGIYYKADILTWLDIMSGNRWGLKPSLYASKDVLKEGWET